MKARSTSWSWFLNWKPYVEIGKFLEVALKESHITFFPRFFLQLRLDTSAICWWCGNIGEVHAMVTSSLLQKYCYSWTQSKMSGTRSFGGYKMEDLMMVMHVPEMNSAFVILEGDHWEPWCWMLCDTVITFVYVNHADSHWMHLCKMMHDPIRTSAYFLMPKISRI